MFDKGIDKDTVRKVFAHLTEDEKEEFIAEMFAQYPPGDKIRFIREEFERKGNGELKKTEGGYYVLFTGIDDAQAFDDLEDTPTM